MSFNRIISAANKAQSRICSVPDCRSPYEAKGYCNAHYLRLLKFGDPLGGGTFHGELMRFIHDVALLHAGDDCLTWPFGKSGGGYGQLRVDGKRLDAHRYVCELVKGPPPTPKHHAAHSCGKGHEGCIAPEHLSWKTRAENKDDELLHGTRNRGDRNGHAKLTEAEAREILALRGRESQGQLAERFMVAKSTITDIQAGRRWSWLSEESKEIAA